MSLETSWNAASSHKNVTGMRHGMGKEDWTFGPGRLLKIHSSD